MTVTTCDGHALEHVPEELLDFFDFDMLQRFGIELRPGQFNGSL